jgi:uncharacterized membrane protein YedE/YeeE
MNWILQPWPWYVSGAVIVFVMALLLFFGKSFGLSSNFRTICAACGAGKNIPFFDFDWKSQIWNLWFLVGAALGGYITVHFLSDNAPVKISEDTIADLKALGIGAPQGLQPMEIFGQEAWSSVSGWILLLGGGILIGFGTRYAGGCTSGHAISGLSNLQLPSLIAVIGFFIGGLTMTWLILPKLLPLLIG